MLSHVLQATLVVSLLAGAVRIASPLLFAALGELVTERAGILNLGLEGVLGVGALVGFAVAVKTGQLWIGVVGAAVAGGLFGLLIAVMTASLKIDQTVTGLTINILSDGIAFYLYRLAFGDVSKGELPTLRAFESIRIPILSDIPVLGPVVFSQQTLTYVGVLMVPVVFLFLYRTKYGLVLRCLGDNPRTVDTKGVSVALYQYLAVIFGCMMAGIGGSCLTLASSGMYVPGISGGRGWIAIALVIFGDWKPQRILLGSLFFGLLDTLQLQLQGVGFQFPYQILVAIPYVVTIVALCMSQRRSGAPINLGIPYNRE